MQCATYGLLPYYLRSALCVVHKTPSQQFARLEYNPPPPPASGSNPLQSLITGKFACDLNFLHGYFMFNNEMLCKQLIKQLFIVKLQLMFVILGEKN